MKGGKSFSDTLSILLNTFFLCDSKGVAALEAHKRVYIILLFVVDQTKGENS